MLILKTTPNKYSCISDDGFRHSLIVYRDQMTKGLRLHAAVWQGELRQVPVWTAFGMPQPTHPSTFRIANIFSVTHQSASSTWIKRVSKTRIRLADVQLYVFCQEYRQQNQRRGAAGAFEICFMSEEGKSCHSITNGCLASLYKIHG